jgi:hypothetical protein
MQPTHHHPGMPGEPTVRCDECGVPNPFGTPCQATRRVDGTPETDADRRFFDLRGAGYTGPIDQDGYAVADPAVDVSRVCWACGDSLPEDHSGRLLCADCARLPEDLVTVPVTVPEAYPVVSLAARVHDGTYCRHSGQPHFGPCIAPKPAVPTRPAEGWTVGTTLRAAADYLDRYGWVQGDYYDTTASTFTPAACLVGAVGVVCYGGPVAAPAMAFDDPGFGDFEAALAFLDDYLARVRPADVDPDDVNAYSVNDTPGRTKVQVTTMLRAAADEYDRVQTGLVHVESPHRLGSLRNCPACTATCYCPKPGVACVHCANQGGAA